MFTRAKLESSEKDQTPLLNSLAETLKRAKRGEGSEAYKLLGFVYMGPDNFKASELTRS